MRYLPTPEQIATECEAIRAGWSERETLRRAGIKSGRIPRVETPFVRLIGD